MVMSVFAIVKLLLEIKPSTFMLYSSCYKITIEFPLSALETMALFFINLFLISFMIQSYFFALMSLCAQFIYFFGIVFLCSLQPGGVCSLVRRGVVVSLPSLLPAPGCWSIVSVFCLSCILGLCLGVLVHRRKMLCWFCWPLWGRSSCRCWVCMFGFV